MDTTKRRPRTYVPLLPDGVQFGRADGHSLGLVFDGPLVGIHLCFQRPALLWRGPTSCSLGFDYISWTIGPDRRTR